MEAAPTTPSTSAVLFTYVQVLVLMAWVVAVAGKEVRHVDRGLLKSQWTTAVQTYRLSPFVRQL